MHFQADPKILPVLTENVAHAAGKAAGAAIEKRVTCDRTAP